MAAELDGWVDSGLAAVSKALREVLVEDGGAGSAFVAYREGELVADLFGGTRVRTGDAAMTSDSPIPVFSGSKGIVASVAALLIDRGLLDPGAKVADYWPEFAAAGKQDITVGQVMSHLAGMPYVHQRITREQAADPVAMAERLAAEPPAWRAGDQVAYHAMTYGWLVAEIIRRIDGRAIDVIVAEEIAAPWKADLWFGIPDDKLGDAADCWRADDYRVNLRDPDAASQAHADRVYGNPPLLGGTTLPWNDPAWRTSVIPGGGALASARGMATMYATLADRAAVGATTLAVMTTERSRGLDPGTRRPLVFGLGFELQDALLTYGPVARAFGHSGAGGSVHGYLSDQRIAFSYVPCLMRTEQVDRRAQRVLAAVVDAL